jgi:hypothetical protein
VVFDRLIDSIDSTHVSYWIVTKAGIPRHQLVLTIKKNDDSNNNLVNVLLENINECYYPYLSLQRSQSVPSSAEFSDELIEIIMKTISEDELDPYLSSNETRNISLPISLPTGTEMIGSAFLRKNKFCLFVNIPLSAAQTYQYFQEKLERQGWTSSSLPWKRSGKGIVDSGFDYRYPKFFIAPQGENKQLSIRTFATSTQATDTEIVYESQISVEIPTDYLNHLSKHFTEYSFLPSLKPHENSLTEIVSERLDSEVYTSTGYIHTKQDLDVITNHYRKQLSEEGWTSLEKNKNNNVSISSWKSEVAKGDVWYCLLVLISIAERVNDYSAQLICFRAEKV